MSPVGPLRLSPADPGVLCWWLWPVLGSGQKAWLSTLTGIDGFQWVWPFNIHPGQQGQQYTCRHSHCFSQINRTMILFFGQFFSLVIVTKNVSFRWRQKLDLFAVTKFHKSTDINRSWSISTSMTLNTEAHLTLTLVYLYTDWSREMRYT